MKRCLLITSPKGVHLKGPMRPDLDFKMRRRGLHLPLWEQLMETRPRMGNHNRIVIFNAEAYPTAYAIYCLSWHRHEEIA